MADLGGHLPPPGSAVWSRDVRSVGSEERSAWAGTRGTDMSYTMIVRHVVIGDAEIWEEPTPYVVYRINVHTQHDHWYLYRRYSQFHSLHKKLVKHYGVNRDLLPPKKMSGNLSKQLIDRRRQLLERYLQKLVHNVVEIARSPELQMFLDVPTHDVVKVTDILTRHLYLHGDQLLANVTPIALSINELYAITLRLQLPNDTAGSEDVAGDLANLYSFVHQLQRLRITPPPPPCSVTCMTFDLSPFRSLHTLKLDHVQLSQVCGLLQVQQHLERLTVQWSLHSLEELLVVSVEERRRGSTLPGGGAAGLEGSIRSPSLTSSEDSWRKAATERLTSSRVVVHSWVQLHTLVLSHNFITHLDNSLTLLPLLRELNISYNRLQVLSVPYLCLPNLEKLNISHNSIHAIDDKGKVLERITHLNLSHNRLYSMDGVKAFVGVHVLNLAYNRLVSSADISKIVKLRRLATLGLEGNPISSSSACRIVVLAKFLLKKKIVELDGLPASSKEQGRILSYVKKYGEEPELWPVAKPLIVLEKEVSVNYQTHKAHLSASEPGSKQPHPLGSTTPPSPHMDLSLHAYQHQSMSHPRKSPPSNLAASSGTQRVSAPSLPLPPQRSAPQSSHTSIDQLSFSSSEQFSQVVPASQAPHRPSSAKTYRHHKQSDETIVTRPHPSSSFSGSSAAEEERFSVGVAHHQLGSQGKHLRGFQPRPDPDGQSDVSSTSPDLNLRNPANSSRSSLGNPHRPSVTSAFSLPPPPPSPALDSTQQPVEDPPLEEDHTHVKMVTPAMIQSALDALQGIPDKATPLALTTRHSSISSMSRQSPVLPGSVTTALTAWISSQSLHQPSGNSATASGDSSRASNSRTPLLPSPPPTPNHPQTGGAVDKPPVQGISAQDLIDALSTLMVVGEEAPLNSHHSSRGTSVPACTPREGFSEWAKMGIRPDEVIHALSALTIHQEVDEDSHRSFLQRSPTASPEPGDFQSESGHLCLFPETVDPYQYSHASSESEEEEELVGLNKQGRRESPDPRESSVSPPEPELEQLDPYLNPHHGSSTALKTFASPVLRLVTSASPVLRQVTSTSPVLRQVTSASPVLRQVTSASPLLDDFGLDCKLDQLHTSGPASLKPEQMHSSEVDQLHARGPVNSEPVQVVVELSPSQLEGGTLLSHIGEPKVKVDTPTEDGSDQVAHLQNVEQVGGVSSSPLDSCLYAES